MPRLYTGQIHNAKACTFDGRDCFIAAIHVDGRFRADEPGDIVSEHATEAEAVLWLNRELGKRGVATPQIRIVG